MPDPSIADVALVLGAAQLQVDRYRVYGHEGSASELEQAMRSVRERLSGPTAVASEAPTAPACPACRTGVGEHCPGCHPGSPAQPTRGRGDAHGHDAHG